MHKLEIVTHCWAGQLEQYARHLQIQLSSVVRYAEQLPVVVTVCYATCDEATVSVLRQFKKSWPSMINPVPLDQEYLFQRAYGRNHAAKRTQADLVWYTDVDYFFRDNALKTLCEFPRRKWERLQIPAHVYRQVDWVSGDRLVEFTRAYFADYGPCVVPPVDEECFVRTKEKLAIGGLMIVTGDMAREEGYLDGTRWMKPRDPAKGFQRCRCDPAFRKEHNLPRKPPRIELPNVLRIRHTQNGRDCDYQQT